MLPVVECSLSEPIDLNTNIDDAAKTTKKMMTNVIKRPPVNIEFTNLSYSVLEKPGFFFSKCQKLKTILNSVSGLFHSGELTAIMGPSGSGKSTLMNILAGYRTSNVAGDITINGSVRSVSLFRKMSCYIMQDDCLCPHLTVAEAMRVAVNLKLGKRSSKENKALVVKEIIDTLGLSECLSTHTSNISGGQRKRLAIALELVNNPPVMFFDEPTSGLDSASCLQCITLLKQLARQGRTIVCTIHQPSARIFEKFDKLYVLAEGHNIFRGEVRNLVPFLSSLGLVCPAYHNPADFIVEVATGEYGRCVDRLTSAVNTGKSDSANFRPTVSCSNAQIEPSNDENEEAVCISMSNFDNDLKPDNGYLVVSNPQTVALLHSSESLSDHYHSFPNSTWMQFRILFARTFTSIIRDETLTKLRVLSHLLVGFLLGLLYWDIGNDANKVYNNSAMLFFCMLFSMFTSMMPTVMTFPLELNTFKREYFNHWYSIKAYYMAKMMADLPFQIVYPVVFVIIVYFMSGQPIEPARLGFFCIMCILTSLVAQSLGLVIGCACEVESAVYLGPITTIPILLFSGFFVNLNNIPTYMYWLSYVAYVRYGFEGTMLSIYGFDRKKLDCFVDYCHFRNSKKFLEELALDNGVYWVDVVALVCFFFVLRYIGYFVLRLRIRAER